MIRLCTELHVSMPKALKAAMKERPDNVPGVVTPRMSALGRSANFAPEMALLFAKRWSIGRTLRIAFMGEVNPAVRQRIIDHASRWLDHAHLDFDWVRGGASDIRIATVPGGSWSYVGTDALAIPKHKPTMNFGWLTPDTDDAAYRRVVLHEFGHALGAVHEHQHPMAGIPWDRPKVYAYYAELGWSEGEVDRNIFAKYDATQINNGAYDRSSIMHYAIPDELTIGDWSVPWNTDLSPQDMRTISAQYPGRQVVNLPKANGLARRRQPAMSR